ncbi:MAG: proteasome accessory factor, partial [Acidimicrobiaceae bacterium]|nr:proteasome accessory factor [Acidimicrobiaceae bacterium]
MSRPAAQDRLARLLAVVPWVAARDGPTIAEVCERFEVTEQDLLDDLDLLFLCGVYPFTPDSLIEVDVADGRVWIRFADYFRRPLRLTAPEGLAL